MIKLYCIVKAHDTLRVWYIKMKWTEQEMQITQQEHVKALFIL